MNLGKLIQYNLRNIFLEKLYTKCGAETIVYELSGCGFESRCSHFFPEPFLKNQN